MSLPRGLRNNNPGNIRRGKDYWQGLSPWNDQTDKEFWVFKTPVWGIRALCKILLTYRRRGLCTVDRIIHRWAPPSENNTGAYVRAVCETLGVSPDEELDFDVGTLAKLAVAIIKHENGFCPYTAEQIKQGVRLALGMERKDATS